MIRIFTDKKMLIKNSCFQLFQIDSREADNPARAGTTMKTRSGQHFKQREADNYDNIYFFNLSPTNFTISSSFLRAASCIPSAFFRISSTKALSSRSMVFTFTFR